jgi:hypothetical protein
MSVAEGMFSPVAMPLCTVDIYPFEGGTYTLQGAQILECITRKNIGETCGEFSIELVPGGPAGVDSVPSWTEIITPRSLAIIAMARMGEIAVSMVGIVTKIYESQAWESEGPVTRSITVTGKDFGSFFESFSFYALWYLSIFGGAATLPPASGAGTWPYQSSLAYLAGPPDQIASAWYNNVMAGTSGILSQTYVPYQDSRVPFGTAMGTYFQPYPSSVYQIPDADVFIGSEGPWIKKFHDILPFPWYEVFIISAPASLYPGATAGYQFSSAELGSAASAGPMLICRVNPQPRLTNSSDGGGNGAPLDGIDASLWNALPLFYVDSPAPASLFPFLESGINFTEEQVVNVFTVNATPATALYGGNAQGGGNGGIAPLLISNGMAGDIASIHRYGYRPANGTVSWFNDPSGTQQQPLGQIVADLLGQFSAYYEPVAIMARGVQMLPLRPDIFPGCRFRCQPFKNEPTYDFYIDEVKNHWVFGGPSSTEISLSRGLPTTVYADTSIGGMLMNALKGNMMRQEGKYVVGNPTSGTTLQGISYSNFASWLALSAQIYATPQMTGASGAIP